MKKSAQIMLNDKKNVTGEQESTRGMDNIWTTNLISKCTLYLVC